MKIPTPFYFALCFICYLGCGTDPAPNIYSIDMKVADIDVLRHNASDVKIVMYGLHREECVATTGNVSHTVEGNTIHVAPRVDVSYGECPATSETLAELWLRNLSIGEYTIIGYARDEYGLSVHGYGGYGTEWLVFRVEADRIVIVRKSLNNTHEFQNRRTVEDL